MSTDAPHPTLPSARSTEFRGSSALPLAGERVAFTGTLASMTHKQAQARVVECGGVATDHVSRQTTMLVVGEEGWPLEDDGSPSVKLLQVQEWQQEGAEIRIVGESDWLGFIGLGDQRDSVRRRYTPAMLSRTLGVSVHQIRRWERMGLIKPVERVYRLPYFDFQEVAGVRKLVELVEAGVAVREIQSSLERLRKLVGGTDRPLVQLEILAGDHQLVYRDRRGRLKTAGGQIVFDFNPPAAQPPADLDAPAAVELAAFDRSHWTAAEWLAEARHLAELGDLPPAVEAFRMSLMEDPDAPDVHFQLAEALYRSGNLRGALERYHVAAELDHQYLEAWTQIGCLHAELGELERAVEAFDVALDLHPAYPDAHIHKAEALHQLGRTQNAVPHWRQYLEFDQRGPWADAARQRLEAAGEQPVLSDAGPAAE